MDNFYIKNYSSTTVTRVTQTELTNHKTYIDLCSQQMNKLKFHCSVLDTSSAWKLLKCWNLLFQFCIKTGYFFRGDRSDSSLTITGRSLWPPYYTMALTQIFVEIWCLFSALLQEIMGSCESEILGSFICQPLINYCFVWQWNEGVGVQRAHNLSLNDNYCFVQISR